MRKGLAAFALFAGCSFPHAERNNGPQDASMIDAPDARVIDARMVDMMVIPPDAAIDAPPPTDTDGDGVVDSADNCPAMANPNQRDHDNDGRGDVCDKCPHLNDPADPDGDMDGVGNACDPRSTTPGDSIALFEGFYDASSIAAWTETGNGNWTVANGLLTQSVTTTSSTTNILSPPGTITRAMITAGARVGMLGSGNGGESPHVSVASGIATNQSYWCSVVDEGNDDKIYATVVRPMMFPSFPSADWNGTFTTNSELRITSTLLGNNNGCNVVQGTTIANTAGNTGSTTGAVGVATRTAAASFDYVFVVSIGN